MIAVVPETGHPSGRVQRAELVVMVAPYPRSRSGLLKWRQHPGSFENFPDLSDE